MIADVPRDGYQFYLLCTSDYGMQVIAMLLVTKVRMPAFVGQVKELVFKPCARLTNQRTLWPKIYILVAGDWLGPIGLIIRLWETGRIGKRGEDLECCGSRPR